VSELIIALVVLVLGAIAVVVRLLIGELRKPARSTAKSTGKRTAGAVGAGSRPVVAATSAAAPVAVAPAAGAAVRAAGPREGALAAGSTATLTHAGRTDGDAPVSAGGATTKAPARKGGSRRVRMRDVVERGDGVRISAWRRLRAFVSLVVLVTVLGLGAAGVVGAIALLIAYALDQAVS